MDMDHTSSDQKGTGNPSLGDFEQRKIVAVCISRKQEQWKIPEIPFYCHTEGFEDIPHYPRLKTRERIEYLARRRNAANKILLEKYPDTTDILQIDSYYIQDVPEIRRLVWAYKNNLQQYGECILGASTWYIDPSRIRKKKWYWDTWTNPEFLGKTPDYSPPWSRNTPIGWQETKGAGGLAIYPRWAWEKQGYGIPEPFPESGCEANYLSRCPGIRTFITFNVQAWRDPPEELRDKPYVDRIRTTVGLRTWMKAHGVPDLYWILMNRVLFRRLEWLKGTVEKDGYRWSTRGVHDSYLAFGGHETWLAPEILSKGTLFVDVGAHVGTWTVRASKYYAHIIAFEPSLKTSSVLRKNLETNKVKNVLVYNTALGESYAKGTMHFFPEIRGHGGNSLLTVHPIGNRQGVDENETLIVPLDSYNLSPDLLKIDTEGYELKALAGARETLSRTRKILVELHSEENKGPVEKILQDAGFKTRLVGDRFESLWVGERS